MREAERHLTATRIEFQCPLKVNKTPVLSKDIHLDPQRSSRRYSKKKKILRKQKNPETLSYIDLFRENERKFKNAILKFNISENHYEEYKTSKKSAKRKKHIYRSSSKQKIVLKIPTMISV